jgi:mannosyltransferase
MVRALHRRGIRAELHLYGSAAGRWEREVAALKAECADIPLVDHGFVPDESKLDEMASHDFYLQYSRFEGFGMSVVEAMTCGVPVVASEECDLARDWDAAGAALVVPMDPERAAARVAERLRAPDVVARLGEGGRAWAKAATEPQAVAAQMTAFYEKAACAWRGGAP